MDKKIPNYGTKIKTISSYFGVSESAAKYMFHRRKRGAPWKQDGDVGYIKWSMQIQNAFIKADKNASIIWENLNFDDDINTLEEHGIIIDEQPNTVCINNTPNVNNADINETDDSEEGWTVVSSRKTHLHQKHILKGMKFLPQNKKPYVKKPITLEPEISVN